MKGAPSKPPQHPIDEFGSGLSSLKILSGLFTIVLGLLDVFFALTTQRLGVGVTTNPMLLRIIVVYVFVVLTFVTFAALLSCLSLLKRVWTNQAGLFSVLSIQLIGIACTLALMYFGNIGVIILLI